MIPSRKKNWEMFNEISPRYDLINSLLSFGMDQRWRKCAASHLPQKKDLDLIDLASGTGDQLIACMESKANIRSAIGIDLASEMLAIAKSKIQSKKYKNSVKIQTANAEHLPFAADSFDAATFSFGIRNVENPQATLTEIYRILRPKGRCLILEFSLPPKPFRRIHLFYLRRILPRVGGYLSQREDAYRYLNETIETFPSGSSFCALLKGANFHSVRQIPLALGAVTLYIGDK